MKNKLFNTQTVSAGHIGALAFSDSMRKLTFLVPCLLAVLLAAGCSSTKVSNRQRLVYDQLPRPSQIVIYDFAASADDIPSDSAFAGQSSASDASGEQLALGRELGTAIASQLTVAVQEMGLPATHASLGTKPVLRVNDIVIRGYLVSIETGSAAKRMTIGFGSGGSELTTAVEGYQMTAKGLRKLGSGTTGARGSKGPGGAVGVAGLIATGNPVGLIVSGGMKIYGEASGSSKIEGRAKQTAKEIADQLKSRFQEENWIQ